MMVDNRVGLFSGETINRISYEFYLSFQENDPNTTAIERLNGEVNLLDDITERI